MAFGFFLRTIGASSLAVLAASALGCTSDEATGGADAGADGIIVNPTPDGSGGDGGADVTTGVTTTFRVAHVSPDFGAFDVCYRLANTTSWQGPLFAPTGSMDAAAPPSEAGDAGATDATADAANDANADASAPSAGVAFGTMSRYVSVMGSGTFDVGLVAAGETSCAHPRALSHVTLDPGKHATVVVMGLFFADAGSAAALAVTAFADDATLAQDAARARFIHAALGGGRSPIGGVSIAAVYNGNATPLVAEVLPGHTATPTSSAPKVDALGYASPTPIAYPSELRVSQLGDAGGSWSTPTFDLQMTASSIHTAILFADGSGDLAFLWCTDGGTGGPLARCAVEPLR